MKIDQLVAELKKPGAAMILVIGGADTGKTSLIEELVDELSRESLIGIVDADIGQTHLGPPTTVAWGKVKGGFKGWDRITIEDFYFTGAISPPGNLLPLTVGTKLMADKALAGCDRVFVDTTGLVEDPVGRVLKQQKIDILAPDVIIAFQRSNELAPILDSLEFQKKPVVFMLPVPEQVRNKSIDARARYRQERFRSYFNGAGVSEFSLENTSLRFMHGEQSVPPESYSDRLVAFRDEVNLDLALGIVEAWDQDGMKLMVRTPLKDAQKVTTVVIGTLNVTLAR